ncbi:hypothetical protein EW026_g3385 [Hermanssonia centrifuga]|uniref:Uncharacterized protein n=1 Tax=Hermanssonia centrifuga TaxID=98765 RepID=A0A4S4KPW7_9APHY|nr:hypothetical protein EW026_g3385 [Hermanssonia centrifuga]
MSQLENTLFNLKFTAKSLARQAKKAQKDEGTEKSRLKKGPFLTQSITLRWGSAHHYAQALQQGNNDGARIYAANAIRKKNEALNLLRLSSKVDAVASRVETAVTMKQMTGNMASVVKGMDKAMDHMNLERISLVMDKFESQFSDLDVQNVLHGRGDGKHYRGLYTTRRSRCSDEADCRGGEY